MFTKIVLQQLVYVRVRVYACEHACVYVFIDLIVCLISFSTTVDSDKESEMSAVIIVFCNSNIQLQSLN